MRLTLSGIAEVCDRLGHDNRPVNASVGTIDPQLDEQIVQNSLHDIPVAHHTGTRVKCIAQLTARRSIHVGVVSDELTGFVEFPIAITTHHRGDDETRGFVERPTGLDQVGAYKKNATVSRPYTTQSRVGLCSPLSITMALVPLLLL